jgi:hypothetical protein
MKALFIHKQIIFNFNTMEKISRIFVLLGMLYLLVISSSLAQTIKTVGGSGADYSNLRTAFLAINNGTLTGELVLQITGSTVESSSASLNASGSGSANYSSLTIYPTLSGFSITGNFADNLINFDGADYVTMDGRVNQAGTADLVISNLNSSGTGARTLRFANDATNNRVQYCNIKGACPSTGSGMISFSTSSSGTVGNSNNTITNCSITNSGIRPLFVIYSSGSSGKENRNNTISNNNFYDFLNPDNASIGIYIGSNSNEWTISGNSFYETSPTFSPSGNFTYKIIRINSTGTNYTISSNFIGGSQPTCGGNSWNKTNGSNNIFTAIELTAGTGVSSNIQGNTIKNINWGNSESAEWNGILVLSGDANIGSISGNTIGSDTGTGSIIYTSGSQDAKIKGINIESSGTINCMNNSIGSVTISTNNPEHGSDFYGIHKSSSAGTILLSNNQIGSISTPNSINASSISSNNAQSVTGIFSASSGNITISNNRVNNLNNGTTNATSSTQGKVNGIVCTSGNSNVVLGNIISDLSIANSNSSSDVNAAVVGIALSGGSSLRTVSGNSISGLKNTFAEFSGSIIGLYFEGQNSSSNLVSGNFIHSFSSPNVTDGTGAIWVGIYSFSGATTFANNIISLSNTYNTKIIGFFSQGSVGNTCNAYFNTIYIGGTTSGNQNSYSFFSNLNNNNRNYRNNIFFNSRSATAGSSSHYAIYHAQTGGTLVADFNDYYTSGVGGFAGYYSGNKTSLPIVTSQDVNSMIVNPGFVVGSSPTDYKLVAEMAGETGTNILTDFGNNSRKTIPSMGAWELVQNQWTGALNNNWSTPGNWTLNTVPQQNVNVIIPGSLVNYPNISGSSEANFIEISTGATLTIAPSGQLSVNGNLINNSGVSGLLIESNASGTGSVILKNAGVPAQIGRWMSGNQWHHCSSPVFQSIPNFLQNNPHIPTNGLSRGMMDFDTEHDQWNSFFTNSSPGDLIASKGFMLRTNADASVNYTGTVNAGTISIETNALGHRWNCIGNPYSAAIKLTGTEGSNDNFYEINFDKIDNIYSAIYIWDNSESTQAYTLVNRASSTHYAALAQGFFVKAKSSATGSFQFTQAMQVHQNTVQLKSVKTDDPEIKLLIANNNLKVKTSIKLIEGMSRGLDVGYDAGILKAEPRLSIFTRLVDDVDAEFMLQCLSNQDYQLLKIPVGFDCSAGGTITISAETLNLPGDFRVILEDKDQQKFVDLAKDAYTTTTNANTMASDRFVLHTSEMTTRISEDAFSNQLKAYVNANKQLQIIGEISKQAVASMYDVQGRLVLHQKLQNVSEQNISIRHLAEGFYLLLIRDEGKQHSFKLKIGG